MARTPDEAKVKSIIAVLKRHPEGTYVSQISRETKLAKTTVSYILNTRLKENVEDVIVGPNGLFRIIKLKQKA